MPEYLSPAREYAKKERRSLDKLAEVIEFHVRNKSGSEFRLPGILPMNKLFH